jgi:hypothetical protein
MTLGRRDFLRVSALTLAGACVFPRSLLHAARRQLILPDSVPGLAVYFPETGHHLSWPFLNFWRSQGNGLTLGAPVSEQTEVQGLRTQYFQFAKCIHSPWGAVRLSPIGDLYAGLDGLPRLSYTEMCAQTRNPSGDAAVRFIKYWRRRGGFAVLGSPVTPVLEYKGNIFQHFQNVRMEYHPETVEDYYRSQEQYLGISLLGYREVQLTPLGAALAAREGVDTRGVPVRAGAVALSHLGGNKRIDVSLTQQTLRLLEGDALIYQAPVSSGSYYHPTVTGEFRVIQKIPKMLMRGPDYYLPNVPYNLYFHPQGLGYFIHGTYWHDRFGATQSYGTSHGCVNLDLGDAEFVYDWSDVGTAVVITP